MVKVVFNRGKTMGRYRDKVLLEVGGLGRLLVLLPGGAGAGAGRQ